MAGILSLLPGHSLRDHDRIESETASTACNSFRATGRIAIHRGRRILAGAVLLLGTGLAGACTPSVTRTSPSREADVYAVWGVMVDSLVGRRDSRLPVLLDTIAGAGGRSGTYDLFVGHLRREGRAHGVTDELIAAFIASDSMPVRIDREVLARYTRANLASLDLDDPEMLQLRRSGRIGTIHLSGVGFDATRSLALVRGSSVCGELCGHGFTVLMDRDPSGRWRQKAALMHVVF